MSLQQLTAGDVILYKDDYYTHVWHGGTLVSVLYNDNGKECDCWSFSKRPECVEDAVERAYDRAMNLLEADAE